MEDYKVVRGAIVGEDGGLLYESDTLRGLSHEARTRLAEIHSEDQQIDWEGASEILIAEGHMREDQ